MLHLVVFKTFMCYNKGSRN